MKKEHVFINQCEKIRKDKKMTYKDLYYSIVRNGYEQTYQSFLYYFNHKHRLNAETVLHLNDVYKIL